MPDPNLIQPVVISHKINKETWEHLQMNGDKMINNFGRVIMKSKGYINDDIQFVSAELYHNDTTYQILNKVYI